MPTYEYSCETCCVVKDLVRRIDDRDRQVLCDHCNQDMVRRVAYGITVVGATVTKPIDLSKQIGRKFETNASYSKYLAESGVREVPKAELKDKLTAARHRKEVRAQSAGYRDHKHKVSELKKKIASDGG